MEDPFEDFIGEEVTDSRGSPIGTLACYWEHEQGEPVLLGIDLGETPHHTHLMPAKGARLDEEQAMVMTPFNKEKVRKAPCLECGCELDAEFENKVFAYYGESSFDYNIRETAAQKRELRRRFRNQSTAATCPVCAPKAPTN